MSNLAKYKKTLYDVLAIPEETDCSSLERGISQNWDSVGHIALISALEEAFDVMFEIEDLLSFKTFEQGIDILKKYGIMFED